MSNFLLAHKLNLIWQVMLTTPNLQSCKFVLVNGFTGSKPHQPGNFDWQPTELPSCFQLFASPPPPHPMPRISDKRLLENEIASAWRTWPSPCY